MPFRSLRESKDARLWFGHPRYNLYYIVKVSRKSHWSSRVTPRDVQDDQDTNHWTGQSRRKALEDSIAVEENQLVILRADVKPLPKCPSI